MGLGCGTTRRARPLGHLRRELPAWEPAGPHPGRQGARPSSCWRARANVSFTRRVLSCCASSGGPRRQWPHRWSASGWTCPGGMAGGRLKTGGLGGPAHTALPPPTPPASPPLSSALGGTERPEPAALTEPPCLSELFKFKLSLSSKGLVSRRMIRALLTQTRCPAISTSAPLCGPLPPWS